MDKKIYFKTELVIIGLGYVGLPLAIRLSQVYKVIGFDISTNRIKELREGKDSTGEISSIKLKNINNLKLTCDKKDIFRKNIYIVAVPTPVNKKNIPNLYFLRKACKLVGKSINKHGIAIFESTVYPGVTESVCGSIIEKESGLKFNKEFFLGYSPERINPGDKEHTIEKITKIVSGSNNEISKIIGKIYQSILNEKVFYCESIKVAEMAKAIENAQRDINIAFINEVAMICSRMDLSVYDVLEASKTKWNFLSFQPGLVGGHCIGVDPYYLSYSAKEQGYNPKLILAGRGINNRMANSLFKIIEKDITKKNRILQIGITFKENVPDIRNSKAADMAMIFLEKGYNLEIYDPVAIPSEVEENYDLKLNYLHGRYDYIIFAVPHQKLVRNFSKIFFKYIYSSSIVFDIKGVLRNKIFKKNFKYKSL